LREGLADLVEPEVEAGHLLEAPGVEGEEEPDDEVFVLGLLARPEVEGHVPHFEVGFVDFELR
jgi:hypothetical protein